MHWRAGEFEIPHGSPPACVLGQDVLQPIAVDVGLVRYSPVRIALVFGVRWIAVERDVDDVCRLLGEGATGAATPHSAARAAVTRVASAQAQFVLRRHVSPVVVPRKVNGNRGDDVKNSITIQIDQIEAFASRAGELLAIAGHQSVASHCHRLGHKFGGSARARLGSAGAEVI